MSPQERFEAIYAAHAQAVQRYALRRTGAAAADDIVAEVFLTTWRRLGDVPDEPRGWLLGVARRAAANATRGDRRRAALHERLVAQSPVEDHQGAAPSRLAEALLSLGEADREALTLVAWDGLTHREAAQALGVREGTFAVRLLRARRRLSRSLARSQTPTPTPTTQLEAP